MDSYADLISDPMHLVESMLKQHDQMAEMLNGFHLQTIEISPDLPGLAISDTLIVHARPARSEYGFRDRLALGDATLVIGPLTRHTAVCFTVSPLRPITISTRRKLDALNGIFIRGAEKVIACHPDDAKAAQQAVSRLPRHPPSVLLG